ncbi:MAG: hypothetical protein ACLFPL_03295 [Candidatus Nanoarchaeia archaeon]
MERKSSINSQKKIFESIFEYRTMIHYLLTVSFIFILMLSIVFLISLSRYALSDADVENHVLNTKSLLEELNQVEQSQQARLSSIYANVSLNYSSYETTSPLSRLSIDDTSLLASSSTHTSYITFRFKNNSFEEWNDVIIVNSIEPIQNEEIVYQSSTSSNYHRGIIIDERNNNDGFSEYVVLSSITDENGNNILERVQKEKIKGVILNR